MTIMTDMNFLSPDSRCWSFDHRANGYARGEGVAFVVVKRLSDAIRDDNTIRAVIRSTALNQDGKTTVITQPNIHAQQALIKEAYAKANLAMDNTRYFEAHGTGTQAGDTVEAQAIGLSFRPYRSSKEPLFIGSVKSNIGHLEGCSGVASLIKVILMLEKGIILPNAGFSKANSKIDLEYLRLSVSRTCLPMWAGTKT